MQREFKRVTTWMCLGLGLMVWLFVGPIAFASQSDDDVTLSLADAIRLAEEQSPSVRLADITLEEARIAYEEARVNQILRPSVITLQQAENAWTAAQHNRALARQDLVMQVTQAYYEVVRTEMALELAERALAQSEAQLASTRVRHEQGMLSDVDLLAAESQVAIAELDLNRSRATHTSARMALNRVLGRNLESSFELVDALGDVQTAQIDLEKAVETALENRLEVQRARDTARLREKELEVSDNPYTPALSIESARLALERARVELREREIDVILEVRQNYQAVIEAQARIPIQESNVTRTKESLRIAQIRYDAGLITSIDVIEAQRAAFQAEMQAIQAVFDYQMAVARFHRSAGLPPALAGE